MRVLIVARTKMGKKHCVGGLELTGNINVRLMDLGGSPQPATCPYQVGQVWDLEYIPAPLLDPPHVEDVLVSRARLAQNSIPDLESFLLAHVPVIPEPPEKLFEGLMRVTTTSRCYISRQTVLPAGSVGF